MIRLRFLWYALFWHQKDWQKERLSGSDIFYYWQVICKYWPKNVFVCQTRDIAFDIRCIAMCSVRFLKSDTCSATLKTLVSRERYRVAYHPVGDLLSEVKGVNVAVFKRSTLQVWSSIFINTSMALVSFKVLKVPLLLNGYNANVSTTGDFKQLNLV